VNVPAAARPEPPQRAGVAALGLGVLGVLFLLLAAAPGAFAPLRLAWFDACQKLWPRTVEAMPATVVAIDERSVARLGQWPWPRTTLASLVRAIQQHGPLAIGIDILMPDADRLSPERLLRDERERDPVLAQRLDSLAANDETLARVIAAAPVVLPFAGLSDATQRTLLAPPIVVTDTGAGTREARIADLRVPAFAGVLGNLDVLDRAAAGHGAISVAPGEQAIRTLPLVVRVGDRLAPSLAIEMLRVAIGAPDLRVQANGPAIERVAVGDLVVPTEPDGALRLYYSGRDPGRTVSAIDVLDGTVDPLHLASKLVIVGATGLAIVDDQPTPLGERMPGSEIHAQLLENVFESSWLRRPAWAPRVELAGFALLGLALVFVAARGNPRRLALLALATWVALAGVGLFAFIFGRTTLDVVSPALALLVLFSVLSVAMLAEARRRQLALQEAIRAQREREARVAGELDAARRIQLGFLPRADSLRDDRRIDVAASMAPAREVGGDLYDYFRLGADRLFFLVGDVAGKGLSASIFMAVSKALYKSAALRGAPADPGALMQAVNVEVSRDNAEMFFVTAFAGVLHLPTGTLAYCNAGHENPVLVDAQGRATRLDDAAGPPLCTVEGFDYRSGTRTLGPGDTLCLFTDGVVDAVNRSGQRFGAQALETAIVTASGGHSAAEQVVDAVREALRAFADGADSVDDCTLLVLRWKGP
jgi:serine phosphatase RsbU (regulator of sigma subunit)/CHASE2 domain-containing sensor protein